MLQNLLILQEQLRENPESFLRLSQPSPFPSCPSPVRIPSSFPMVVAQSPTDRVVGATIGRGLPAREPDLSWGSLLLHQSGRGEDMLLDM